MVDPHAPHPKNELRQRPRTYRQMRTANGGAAMDAELLIAEQIARLFQRRAGVVWELIVTPGPARTGDVPIRDADGAPVAYAHPAAA